MCFIKTTNKSFISCFIKSLCYRNFIMYNESWIDKMAENRKRISYELSTNFDTELIDGIKKYDTHHQIRTIFGKMRKDIFGGGRASMTLPQLSLKELKAYINMCHSNKILFNYLINPACLGNREVNPHFHKKIVRYIGDLCDAQIDAVTVNSPYLCELIKKQFPHLRITVGVAVGINDIQHIQSWYDLGANEITLTHDMNRNFLGLENILRFTKGRNITVRLIANNICLHACPFASNHSKGQAHASQKGSKSSNLFVDYNLLSCNHRKLENPELLISSEWIRPEDVHYYEELCDKVGNYNLSLKLLDRTKTTNFLLRVVKAYIEESYDGNLIDIVNWLSKKQTKEIHKGSVYWSAIANGYNIGELLKYEDAFSLPDFYIDNKKLDGFLKHFVNNDACSHKICGLNKNITDQPNIICRYCAEWASKVISFNKEAVDEWLKKSEYTLEALKTSKFFK